MRRIEVTSSLSGLRLDAFLFKAGATLSRSKAETLIEEGFVFVNGKNVSRSYKVSEADVIEIQEQEEKPSTLQGEDIPLEIVYEDEDIIVINKPAGLVVHPGNGNESGTLVNALLGRGTQLSSSSSRPGIVHRIDKDTSGLLVVAKNDEAMLFLQSQLADHSMHREYMALVKGIILESDGKIDAPIGRDRIHPTKQAVDLAKGKESVTYFHVEKRFRKADATLISCRLLTGRTHQIRVHMEYIGHPVIGDPVYGSGNRKLYKEGQLLHAYRLTLTHPRSKKEMSFEAPLPPYFQQILAEIEE